MKESREKDEDKKYNEKINTRRGDKFQSKADFQAKRVLTEEYPVKTSFAWYRVRPVTRRTRVCRPERKSRVRRGPRIIAQTRVSRPHACSRRLLDSRVFSLATTTLYERRREHIDLYFQSAIGWTPRYSPPLRPSLIPSPLAAALTLSFSPLPRNTCPHRPLTFRRMLRLPAAANFASNALLCSHVYLHSCG